MRVLFINTFYAPDAKGGAEIILQEQVDGLKHRGHKVAVLCIGRESGLRRSTVNGVPVYRAGIRNLYFPDGEEGRSVVHRFMWHMLDMHNPLMAGYLRRVIDAEEPDVISCHNLSGWSVSVWTAAAGCGVPVVQVLHDHYLLCPKSSMFDGHRPCGVQCGTCRLMRFRHASLSGKIDAVVGVSNYILDRFSRNGYFRGVSYAGVICNVRSPELVIAGQTGGGQAEVTVFGFIGALVPSKGIELLLQEFIANALPDWRLRVAGSGSQTYESYLRTRFDDPRIGFLGRQTPREFFPSIDICIVPSLGEEALGMVVIEALLSGIPVIGTDRGGIPEMLRHGQNGILFDPDEAGALAHAMATMAESVETWRRDRQRIKQGAMVFADRAEWLKKWEEVYENVI